MKKKLLIWIILLFSVKVNAQTDTIHVLILASDITHQSVPGNVLLSYSPWVLQYEGYEVREIIHHNAGQEQHGDVIILNEKAYDDHVHLSYLDDKKKPFKGHVWDYFQIK